jgi:hypothetical protein
VSGVLMRGSTLFLVSLVGGVACGGESTRPSGDGASNGGSSAGSNQGGQATGGSSAGGASGAGQTGGAMPTGGSPNPPRDGICTTVADCAISTDCCNCFAAGPGEATASCRRACTPETTACALEGVTASDVMCVAGRCVLDRFCDLERVTCERARPACPAGTVPSRIGDCYGPCTGVSECSTVTSCDDCESAGLACVESTSPVGPLFTCASTPPECEANPTCACMGVCQDAFVCIEPDSTHLFCDCPHC